MIIVVSVRLENGCLINAGSVGPGALYFLLEYVIINGRAKRAASEASQKGHLTSSGFIVICI